MFNPRARVVLVLALLAALIAIARLHSYHEPIERDLATYAVVAREWLAGRTLYSDLWDNRAPPIYLTYAAAQLLVGPGPACHYLLGVATAVVTLVGVYVAGSARGGAVVGLWSAAFWTFVQGHFILQANQPNTEVFLNACMTWAFALLVRAGQQGLGDRRALLVGGLFALASLYKHIAIAPAVIFALAHFAAPPGGSGGRRRAFREVLLMAAVGFLAWAGLCAYLAATHRLEDFWEAVFVFNRWEIRVLGGNLIELRIYQLVLAMLVLLLPVGLAIGVGLVLIVGRPWSRAGVLLAAFALGTFLSMGLPGRLYPHYYQLWLPVLVLTAAWSLDLLRTRLPEPGTLVMHGSAAAVVGLLAYGQLPGYLRTPEELSAWKYGTPFDGETRRLAAEITELLHPGETFFEWGDEPQFYFYTGCRPPTGVLWTYYLMNGPTAPKQARRAAADLDRAPPELFIVRVDESFPLDHPVVAWFTPRYAAFPFMPHRGFFLLYARKGGALERRLQALTAVPGR